MQTTEKLKVLFNTKLQEPLGHLQPLAENTSSKIKKLEIIYFMSLFFINAIVIYFVSASWEGILFTGIVFLLYKLFAKYLNIYILYILIIAWVMYMLGNDYYLGPILSGILIVISQVHISDVAHEYSSKYENTILEPLLKEFNPDWKYDAYGHVYKKYFKDSWVFPKVDFMISGTERFKGEYLGVKFQISNVETSKIDINEDGDEKSGKILHDGVVFACELNKSLKYRTVILPDKTEKKYGSIVGRWLQSKKKNRMKLMNLDYPEFEKEFQIYGQDEIETRYVLNHNIMKNILLLKKQLGDENLIFAFYLKHFVIFSNHSYSFATPKAEHLQNFAHIENDFNTVQTFVSAIETLKLNENLWSE